MLRKWSTHMVAGLLVLNLILRSYDLRLFIIINHKSLRSRPDEVRAIISGGWKLCRNKEGIIMFCNYSSLTLLECRRNIFPYCVKFR